jgi:dTDP-4-amino-4,6-dideoxygalactose transaminase
MRIPFGTITVTDKSKILINEILESKRLSNGKYVREFEERFAQLVGVDHAVAVSSGTDALIIALATLYENKEVQRNDEIIVPALSFVATGNSVLHAGFKPVFVDIDRKTLNIDVKKIEEKITEKTRAVIAVHLMGKPADMNVINDIAKKYNLIVIEDAAEAHGATYRDRKVGAIGDISAFSLYIAHIISTVEGGIILTKNKETAEILRSLRAHGRACKCQTCVLNSSSMSCDKRFRYGTDIRFISERIGFSSKMNELEAAIGLGNLDLYDIILEKRRENLKFLLEGLKEFDEFLYSIKEEEYEKIGPHALPIILNEVNFFYREQLVEYLNENSIDTRNLFSSIPTQCGGFEFLGYHLGDFKNAEYIGENAFHIGVHQDLSISDCEYVLETLRRFLKK